jgi:hypothetical protein
MEKVFYDDGKVCKNVGFPLPAGRYSIDTTIAE